MCNFVGCFIDDLEYGMLKKVWKVIRAIVSVLLLAAVLVPALVYVLLSLDGVQNMIRNVTSEELSHLLGARVEVGRLSIRPFNRVLISNVCVVDSGGSDTMATIQRVSAGINLPKLLRAGEVSVDYALLDGLFLNVWRADSASPLNVQPVLDHLRSDRPRQRSTPFELSINTVVVRRSGARYDILSAPEASGDRFDASHIAVSDLAINAFIPTISNRGLRIDLNHMSARERCGFELRRLSARLGMVDSMLSVADLEIDLNRSEMRFDSIAMFVGRDLRQSLSRCPVELRTERSLLYVDDFAPFAPLLGEFNVPLELSFDILGKADSLEVRSFMLTSARPALMRLSVAARGTATKADSIAVVAYDLPLLAIDVDGRHASGMNLAVLSPKLRNVLASLGNVHLYGSGRGDLSRGSVDLHCQAADGTLDLAGTYHRLSRGTRLEVQSQFDNFNFGAFAAASDPLVASGKIRASGVAGRRITGEGQLEVSDIRWHDNRFRNLRVRLDMPRSERLEATVTLDDPNATALIYAFYEKKDGEPTLSATASLANISLENLGITDFKPGYRAGAKMIIDLAGHSSADLRGNIDITDLRMLDNRNRGYRIPRIAISASAVGPAPYLSINSDLLNGCLQGFYSFESLPGQLRDMASCFVPALFEQSHAAPRRRSAQRSRPAPNDFSFDFTLSPTDELSSLLELPVTVAAPARITGFVHSSTREVNIEVDAPYIYQGDKIYSNTVVYGRLDCAAQNSALYLTTEFPTKKGDMVIDATMHAALNRIDTNIDWTIQRAIPINGTMDFSTDIRGLASAAREPVVPLDATVTFNPGTINFGYDTWTILPARITMGASGIDVEGLRFDSGEQHIAIDGRISRSAADTLSLALSEVNLLPIFETLEIDKAMLSGKASGTFHAASLFSNDRYLECPHLTVDSIGYNRCTIGDADILARWNPAKQSFYLDADIKGDDERRSTICGDILTADGGGLDLYFDVDSVPVSFLKPFMDAFAKDITGRASGNCHLFGTFSEVDLSGDVYARDVSVAIDFTNTVYTTSDSVHMRPGEIIVPATTMYDAYGNTAIITGVVNHIFFKQPSFDFNITDARDFLTYNVPQSKSPRWFGTIFGSGTASVSGHPGVVNIGADMTATDRTEFTFVLTDQLDAVEYSFLEFRDVTPDSVRIVESAVSDVPESVRNIRERLATSNDDEPSDYVMRLSVDITPQAKMNIIMDEATGDVISATGSGHLTMTYNSVDEDLRMYGNYLVDKGSYHFTLQDIIVRDFVIEQGSTIGFDGDPYAMKANLKAYNSVVANLGDLDKSFLQDRDLSNTTVPVHAVMYVKGDIRQPELTFDLELPDLNPDALRKVKSIVSTTDMMNRQIIYLLALGRFYTPDYMNTKQGNELFAVASSTLSTQLTSMLGKLSENWSIAPNLRSDRGDFSDVEVDVALSSRLLNNRLLLNGNFGYRDKTYNTNQFVGDFDIEYLLNPRGTWRLKAYNRYNDANYYLRSAATTQGVGLVYRRDFDNIFSFLRRKPKANEAPVDTVTTDSVPTP